MDILEPGRDSKKGNSGLKKYLDTLVMPTNAWMYCILYTKHQTMQKCKQIKLQNKLLFWSI